LDSEFGQYPGDPYYHSVLSVASDQPFTGYYRYQSLAYEDAVIVPLIEASDYSSLLLLPHNTVNKEWWTGVGIFNPMAQTVTVSVKPYGENGVILNELVREVILDPGEYDILSIKGIYKEDALKIAFIRFETQNTSQLIGGFFLHASMLQGISGGNLQKLAE